MTYKKDLERFFSLPAKSRLLIAVILTGAFLFTIVLFANIGKNPPLPSNQMTRITTPKQAVQPEINQYTSTLSLSPRQASLPVGEELDVSVILTENPAQAVDIVLEYDPQYLEVSNIRGGTSFTQVLLNQRQNGRILFSAALDPASSDKSTVGEIFSFTLKGREATPAATIDFSPSETKVGADGQFSLGTTLTGNYQIVEK